MCEETRTLGVGVTLLWEWGNWGVYYGTELLFSQNGERGPKQLWDHGESHSILLVCNPPNRTGKKKGAGLGKVGGVVGLRGGGSELHGVTYGSDS